MEEAQQGMLSDVVHVDVLTAFISFIVVNLTFIIPKTTGEDVF